MALGSIKIVITLAALSLGATLFDIGLIIAGNATVSIVASIGWGRLSDYFGLRIRFLVIFFLASAPLFVLLGLANAVWQLIALFTVFAVSTAGIQPIAAMYAVESNEGKNWQKEIVKYNSYWNTGVIAGLVVNSLLALVMPLSWLLYIASGFCVVSALIVWRTAKEPDLPLEREAYAIINVQDEEQPTTMSVLDYFDIRKIPKRTSTAKTGPSTVHRLSYPLDRRLQLHRGRGAVHGGDWNVSESDSLSERCRERCHSHFVL